MRIVFQRIDFCIDFCIDFLYRFPAVPGASSDDEAFGFSKAQCGSTYCGCGEFAGGGLGADAPPNELELLPPKELLLPNPVPCPNELLFVLEFPDCPFCPFCIGCPASCKGGWLGVLIRPPVSLVGS